jgi:AraC-like DNA-binding protein
MISDPSRDALVFHLTMSGQSALTSELGEVIEPAGCGHVLTTREPIKLVSSPQALRLGVMVDRAALGRTLNEHFGVVSKSELTFSPTINGLAPNGAFLRSLAESFLDGAALHPEGARTTDAVAEALLLLLLDAFPNSHTDLIKATPPRLPPRHVRRAIEVMEEHAAAGLSIVSVANLLGVSARALQYAFLRHVGVTPVRYMHSIRLRRAVGDLATRPDLSAREVSVIWGFSNFSRFSAACLKTYGKRPHDIQRDGIRR